MSHYSHSHPFPPRGTAAISDYITNTVKKPKSRKPKIFSLGSQRSKSSSPPKSYSASPYVNVPQSANHVPPRTDTFIGTFSQVETPIIVQSTRRSTLPQPPLYLIHPDAEAPIDLPPWVAEFRPRIPPLRPGSKWESPIPECDNITHAILTRQALTKFHLAVYLADEDAGESEARLRQNLAQICCQYMPAMWKLKIRKHQIVFFYHGRKQIRLGNQIWDAVTEWEEQWLLEHAARGMRPSYASERGDIPMENGWPYNTRYTSASGQFSQDVLW